MSGPEAGRREAGPHRVLSTRQLSSSAFVLRLTREALAFRPGQWLSLGPARSGARREYSIYSSPADPFLEVLVKEIPQGLVSPALRRCRPGDELEVDGPHGSFVIPDDRPDPGGRAARFLFVATGTGLSPFRCFVRSYPSLDYRLLHGVRDADELYESESFEAGRFLPCLSRAGSRGVGYRGRVTSYLAEHMEEEEQESPAFCYLCGNSAMIYEAYAILRERGVPRSRVFAEVYF